MNVIKMQRIERMMISAARMLLLAIGCLLSLPGGTNVQQVKLKAALQVPITELLLTKNAVTIENL
jgi:hypothetical protein